MGATVMRGPHLSAHGEGEKLYADMGIVTGLRELHVGFGRSEVHNIVWNFVEFGVIAQNLMGGLPKLASIWRA